MGCCKSSPLTLPIPVESPQKSLNYQRAARKEKFITARIRTITEKYDILRALGSGTIGTLFHAKESKTGIMRTIREVNKSAYFFGLEAFQEINILRDLDHPNILKVIEAVETPRSFYVVLENISGGTLQDKYKKVGYEGLISKYVQEMFCGLNYLHKLGIVHCNLSPDYIVLSNETKEAVVKIIGFTAAQRLSEKKEIDMKTLKVNYASPEMFRGEFNEKTDFTLCTDEYRSQLS